MCGIKIVIDGSDCRVAFRGSKVISNPIKIFRQHDVWVEIPCERTDEHAVEGLHTFTVCEGIQLTWTLPKDLHWQA